MVSDGGGIEGVLFVWASYDLYHTLKGASSKLTLALQGFKVRVVEIRI
jgi:hypothetical protein